MCIRAPRYRWQVDFKKRAASGCLSQLRLKYVSQITVPQPTSTSSPSCFISSHFSSWWVSSLVFCVTSFQFCSTFCSGSPTVQTDNIVLVVLVLFSTSFRDPVLQAHQRSVSRTTPLLLRQLLWLLRHANRHPCHAKLFLPRFPSHFLHLWIKYWTNQSRFQKAGRKRRHVWPFKS